MKRKFTIFALFYFVHSRANSKYKPPGDLYSEGRFNGGFILRTIFFFFGGGEGAYIWRGVFSEFYGSQEQKKITFYVHFSGQHVMQDKYLA